MKHVPHVISWNLTKSCNLSCSHCYLPTNNPKNLSKKYSTFPEQRQYTKPSAPSDKKTDDNQELDTDTAIQVINDISAINPNIILILTGGEPLLRDDIFDLSKHASQKGMMVLLGTNACLIDDATAGRLKENGFSGIGISLDSLDPELHDEIRGVKGSWNKAVEGIDACKREGLEVQIQTTVFKKNYNEIPEIVAFASDKGVKVFNLFFLVCTGRGQDLTDITPEQYEKALQQIYKLHTQYEGKMLVSAKCAPHYRRVAYEMNPESALLKYYSGGCPAGTNYVRITPEGNVTPCPYMDTSCGNLREKSFREIWDTSKVLEELRNADLKGRCGECEFVSLCKGCRARALATTGDQMAEDSWCDYEPGKYGGKKITLKTENTFGLKRDFELSWSEDARKRLDKVPSFGRGMVIKRVEEYARENGVFRITPEIMKEAKEKMAVDKKMMFPFLSLLKKNDKSEKIEWTLEALERVKKAPDFVRPGIYKLMEIRSRERGCKLITSEFLSEIRDESMMFASNRIKKLGFDDLTIEAFDVAKLRMKNKKKKDIIDSIKVFLEKRTGKNDQIITKFQKYLSQKIDTTNKPETA
ncbi:MAG: radical SAM protein [Candidatus Scalindua sp.]|nr:radical SAM protein [Candidatus Scalindua sp.]